MRQRASDVGTVGTLYSAGTRASITMAFTDTIWAKYNLGAWTIFKGEPAPANQPESRTDHSQAATEQSPSEKVREEAGPIGNRSMNNGTYPELRVEKVSGSGQKCAQ